MDGATTLAATHYRSSSPSSSSWTSALYVPVAAGTYTLVLAVYLVQLSRTRRHLMAAKRFYLNPATISLLATATKVPSDVTGTPPGILDDLLRLTAILLYCLTITLSLPAIGAMRTTAILTNLLGLFVYLAIEVFNLVTAPTKPFHTEQRLFGAVMLFLFAVLVSHYLTVSVTRRRIENKYQYWHADLLRQSKCGKCNRNEPKHPGFDFRELRKIHEKYWVMAVTSNPEWALRAWGSLLVCNILTWGVAGVGVVHRIARALHPRQWLPPYVRSSSEKLAASLLLLHFATIALGFAASMLQFPLFNPVNFLLLKRARPLRAKAILQVLLNVEDYRLEKLLSWRQAPLPLPVPRAPVFFLRAAVLDIVKMLHIGTIFGCNLVLMAWALTVSGPYDQLRGIRARFRLGRRFEPLKGMENYDLRLREAKYEDLDRSLMELPRTWIHGSGGITGTRDSENLLQFLKNHVPEQSKQLYSAPVDKDLVKGDYPPHSCTLTVLVLAKIIDFSFGKTRPGEIRKLKRVVREGIRFTRLVDLNCGPTGDSAKMMRTAVNWAMEGLGLELQSRLLDVFHPKDLFNIPPQVTQNLFVAGAVGESAKGGRRGETTAELVTKRIEKQAQQKVRRMMEKSVSDRRPKLFLNNCFYRVAASLNSWQRKETEEELDQEKLEQWLAAVLIACLSNLPLALLLHCSGGEYGAKEERVREATQALGDAKGIIDFLNEKGDKYREVELGLQKFENDWYNPSSNLSKQGP